MPLYITSATNSIITLEQLIASRDARKERQLAWLENHPATLISYTVVAPGPMKDSELTRRIFNHGIRALRQLAETNVWEIKKQTCLALATGPEGLLAIDALPAKVKLAVIELEQSHPLGRLWDIDILTQQGQILSRRDFDLPPRSCLVCQRPANICAREQTHTLPELIIRMKALLDTAENASHF